MRLICSVLSVLIFVSSCNLVGQNRRPAQHYTETDESIVKVQFPLKTLDKQFSKLATSSDFIKKVNYFQMDSVTRILQVGLTIQYPLNALFNEEIRAPREINETHDIDISISFPKAKSLSMSRYLSLKFEKFNIDGKSYLNHFEVVFTVLKTVLVNTPLIDYIESESKDAITNETQRNLLKEMLESNKIVFFPATRKVAIKLDFNMIGALKDFSELEDIRLWQFSPFLLKGTKDVFFRLEAGLGKPSSVWIDEYNQRVNEDTRTILQVRDQLYQEFSNIDSTKSVLFHYLSEHLNQENIDINMLPKIYKNEFDRFLGNLYSNIPQVLSQNNENFIADPEYEYIQFIDDKKNLIRNYITHLDRRLSIDYNILQNGSHSNNSRPLITKLISQDAINGGFNFLKDLDYEGYRYMKESQLHIAPNLPGVIFKGKLNVDKKNLLGLIDKSFLTQDIKLPFVEAAEGIPFEVVGEVRFEDDGMLGIDAKSISLFEGKKKLVFDRNDENTAFILDFIKLWLADSMSTLSYDISDDNEDENHRIKEMVNYLNKLQELYSPENRNQIFQNITNTLENDIVNNPFSNSGEQYVKKKSEILYGYIFKYDERDQQFKIHVDPSIISDNIKGVQHNLQVWNVSPIMSKELNNTFLEIAVGQGKRPQSYVEELYYRQNQLENSDFSGIYNDLDRSKVDLLITLNLQYLEYTINNILSKMTDHNTSSEFGDIEKKLKVDEEQEYNIIDHIQTNITSSKELELEIHATRITKKKKGFIWKKWKITRDPISIKAILNLKSKKLSEVRPYLRSHKEELYFTDQALILSPSRVELKMGRPSLVNSILNKIAKVNFNSGLGSVVKKILLKITHNYFEKSYKDDNKEILGDSLNEMFRVLTTKNELVVLLNPRMSGAALELKLAGEDNFSKTAIKYDYKNQELNIALSVAPQMAKIDKKKLLDMAIRSENLLGPYLSAGKSKFKKLIKENPLIVNDAVVETSAQKSSIYNDLVKQIASYDQVLQLANIGVRAPNDARKMSTNGSELMYFAASAYILYNRIYKFSEKAKKYNQREKIHNFEKIIEARTKLYHNIFKPLMIAYRDKYHIRNKKIKSSKLSYWNSNFYPDAIFSEAIFKELLKEGIR